MSVNMLKAALAQKPDVKLAIVSNSLFSDLMQAGEIDVCAISYPVPSDPKYKKVIDDFFVSIGIDPNAPASFIYYMMRNVKDVHVQLASQHDISLIPSGTGSFVLK